MVSPNTRFYKLSQFLIVIIFLMLILLVLEMYEFYRTIEYRQEVLEIQEENVINAQESYLEIRQRFIQLELEQSYKDLRDLQDLH